MEWVAPTSSEGQTRGDPGEDALPTLSEEQIALCTAVVRWIAIMQENGHAGLPSSNDVRHSRLLARLINGQEPLPEAPPVSFGYPWYDLVEQPGPHVCDVEYHRLKLPGGITQVKVPRILLINKEAWTVLTQIGPNDFIVRCNRSGVDCHVWRLTDAPEAVSFSWRIQSMKYIESPYTADSVGEPA